MPWTVEPDYPRNRLYISLTGVVSAAEMSAMRVHLVELAKAHLKPGWTFISDLRNMKTLSQDAVAELARGAEECKAHGLTLSVRIIPKVTVSVLQYQRATKTIGYEAHSVFSMEEAEALVDQLKPPSQ